MITYLDADATKPLTPGNKVIVHVCNDKGGWGKGFVVSISKRWKLPEKKYREWYESKKDFELGKTQFVNVEENITIANMVAQNGYKSAYNLVPLKYDALERCLETVALFAIESNASIHMPRIGIGYSGGNWIRVEEIIKRTLCNKNIDVFVYDYSANNKMSYATD